MKFYQLIIFLFGLFLTTSTFAISGSVTTGFTSGTSRPAISITAIATDNSFTATANVRYEDNSFSRGNFEIDVPSGKRWILQYNCSECEEFKILNSGYYSEGRSTTVRSKARQIFGTSQVNFDLIQGITKGGNIQFPTFRNATDLTRHFKIIAENTLDSAFNQETIVSFQVGEKIQKYEILLPLLNGSYRWKLKYECSVDSDEIKSQSTSSNNTESCINDGIYPQGYFSLSGTVTSSDNAYETSAATINPNLHIPLIKSTSIKGQLLFPNGKYAEKSSNDIKIIAEHSLDTSLNREFIVTFPIGEQSQEFDFPLPFPSNGEEFDWKIKYQCFSCEQEKIVTEAYYSQTGMVIDSSEAFKLTSLIQEIKIEIDLYLVENKNNGWLPSILHYLLF